MMIAYHGDRSPKLIPEPGRPSRYGFRCLFFTPDETLARLYALHWAKMSNRADAGFVYQAEILTTSFYVHDLCGRNTHTAEFRNLIHTFNTFRIPGVLIKNALDYPSESIPYYSTSDILAVFNISLINRIELMPSLNTHTLIQPQP